MYTNRANGIEKRGENICPLVLNNFNSSSVVAIKLIQLLQARFSILYVTTPWGPLSKDLSLSGGRLTASELEHRIFSNEANDTKPDHNNISKIYTTLSILLSIFFLYPFLSIFYVLILNSHI